MTVLLPSVLAMTRTQGPAHKRDLTRRKVIAAGGVAVAGVGVVSP